MRISIILFFATVILLSLFSFRWLKQTEKPRILVFSKTAGFRHESIAAGKAAIIKLGAENDFVVDTSEDSKYFGLDSLKNYKAIVFLNTTGDILDATQQLAFEHFIQTGGGYVGIHAAADTEYEWTWYGKLVGGYFLSHPKIQEAIVNVTDRTHATSRHLPQNWKRTDEWYNYKTLNPDVNVLASMDESSYLGGTNGANHPIAWYHQFDGGRAFYTGMGHTPESYEDPLYLTQLMEGIKYAIGENITDDINGIKVSNQDQKISDAQAGGELVLKSDCSACHKVDAFSIAPSFTEIANKYKNDPNVINYFATKIIKGSSGNWNVVEMPPHASMTESDAKKIAKYILSLN